MTMRIHARSDPGLERQSNEDAFLVLDVTEPDRGFGGRTEASLDLQGRPALVAVADGMGGGTSGDLASELALKALAVHATETARNGGPPGETESLIGWLVDGVRKANSQILSMGVREEASRGMGTTLTAAILDSGSCVLVHVGDSRAYHLRDDRFMRLTVDHSFVQSQIAKGKMTPAQAETHPQRNQLLEALGVHDSPRVDHVWVVLRPGDRLLLCSDGVYDLVKDGELADILGGPDPPADQTAAIVALARERGGFDNITAVVVHLE